MTTKTTKTTRIAIYPQTDGQWHLHREGCRHTKTADFQSRAGRVCLGIYDTVLEAVEGFLDEEMQEQGWGVAHLEVAACCKAKAADFATRQ